MELVPLLNHSALPSIQDLNCLTVEYLPIVLVVFAVVGPPEAGAQAEVRQLDVTIRVWGGKVRGDLGLKDAGIDLRLGLNVH